MTVGTHVRPTAGPLVDHPLYVELVDGVRVLRPFVIEEVRQFGKYTMYLILGTWYLREELELCS